MRDEEKGRGKIFWNVGKRGRREKEMKDKKYEIRKTNKKMRRKKEIKGYSRENIEDTPSLQLTKRYFFFIFITYFFGITKFFRIFAGD